MVSTLPGTTVKILANRTTVDLWCGKEAPVRSTIAPEISERLTGYYSGDTLVQYFCVHICTYVFTDAGRGGLDTGDDLFGSGQDCEWRVLEVGSLGGWSSGRQGRQGSRAKRREMREGVQAAQKTERV